MALFCYSYIMKKKYLWAITLIVLAIALIAGVLLFQKDKSSLIRECPDEWIEDRMPSVENENSATERQYFIFNGERKEIKDYDVDWIKNNCSVEVQYAY